MNYQFDEKIRQFIQDKSNLGLLRTRTVVSSKLNFSSNDYLGLSSDPDIKHYFSEGFLQYPVGSSGSALISGYHDIHYQLETKFASIFNRDAAILFPSAYSANLAIMFLIKTLAGNLIIDKLCHASIYDGINLAKIDKFQRYLHNDYNDLAQKKSISNGPSIIITESLFSMSGNFVNLKALNLLCEKNDSVIILDEAHAFGCYEEDGVGLGSKYSQDIIPLINIGFGKAMGAQGAVVVGKSQWIEALLQVARTYIYSTAISPGYTYGLLKTFEKLITLDAQRIKLYHIVKHFNTYTKNSQLNWQDSLSPIQALKLGCPQKSLKLAQLLMQDGIYCAAIRPPTVSLKNTGLRVVLRADHSLLDLENLISKIEYWCAKERLA